MFEQAQGNAVQRVTFLRWWRTGWGEPGPNAFGDGHLQVNFTDDDTGATVKTDVVILDTPAGEALVYSLAALNGLTVRQDLRLDGGKRIMDWEVGRRTPFLHGWQGYLRDPGSDGPHVPGEYQDLPGITEPERQEVGSDA